MRKLALLLALLLTGLVLGLLISELLVRRLFPDPNLHLTGMCQEDPELGYFWAKPDYEGRRRTREYDVTVKTNSLGLRDYERPLRDDAYKILAVGDSFTFGSWVDLDDSYLSVLERTLSRRADRAVQVIKAGMLGRGAVEELRFLEVKGARFDPDCVVVGFFVGNDFRDTLIGVNPYRVVNGLLLWREPVRRRWESYDVVADDWVERPVPAETQRAASPGGWFGKAKGYVRTHSHVYQGLAKLHYARSQRAAQRARARGEHTLSSPEAQRHTVFEFEAWQMKTYPATMREGVDRTLECLLRMRDRAHSLGARFVVLLIPDSTQVHPDPETRQAVLATWPPNQQWDLSKPQRLVSAWGAEHGVPVLDLLPAFQRESQRSAERLYYEEDLHWNVNGHRLAGRLLSEWLVEEGIVHGATP